MGRKLVREKDQREAFVMDVCLCLGDVFFSVADQAMEQGVSLERVHAIAWGSRSRLTKDQLNRLRCYLVEECGAIATGAFSSSEGISEDLEIQLRESA